jgi:phage terminase small subunit
MATIVNTAVVALNPKQLAFVAGYLKSGNATQAYIDAGYSAKGAQQASSRLLSNVVVAAEVARGKMEYSRLAGLTLVDILEEEKRIAFSDIAQAFDPITSQLLPIHQIPIGTRAALTGWSKHPTQFGDREEVKFADKAAKLRELREFVSAAPPAPVDPVSVTNNTQINIDKLVLDLSAAPISA